jgi:hypothetical protein
MLRKLAEYFSRKFVLSLASLVGSFALVWYDKDLAGWTYAMLGILGLYNGANVYQDHVLSKKTNNQTDQQA